MNIAIIFAGGVGTRMNTKDRPKQFLMVHGKPIIVHTIEKFQEHAEIDGIIVVCVKDWINYMKEMQFRYRLDKIAKIVPGGKTGQLSIYAGLKAAEDIFGVDDNIVLIHDGARPFISERIINEGIKFAEIYGAAAPGVMPKDTIKVKNEKNFSIDTPNRANLVSIQTPQVFKFDEILECHEKIRYNGEKVTDDTMVVEKYGYSVYLYDGEYTNIKVTTPEDLILAERLI